MKKIGMTTLFIEPDSPVEPAGKQRQTGERLHQVVHWKAE
jgi:hypothetical protein